MKFTILDILFLMQTQQLRTRFLTLFSTVDTKEELGNKYNSFVFLLSETAPFAHCGADMFGPIVAKQGRSEVKRLLIMFACMASTAVYIKVAFTLDTISYIPAFIVIIDRH